MLEVNSHKHLKKYYQNNLALWPHNLTLTRLISRSLSRKDNTFIQLSSDSKNFWWPGLLIPLCLHNNNIVLILSERQHRLLFEVELPKLRSSRLGFDYVEGIELIPSDKKIWVLRYQDLIFANEKDLLKNRQLIFPESEFMSNEIRSDAIQVLVFEKSCMQNNCKTKKIKSKLEGELKLAILKKAALFEKDDFKKYKETVGKKRGKSIDQKINQ